MEKEEGNKLDFLKNVKNVMRAAVQNTSLSEFKNSVVECKH